MIRTFFKKFWVLAIVLPTLLFSPACKKRTKSSKVNAPGDSSAELTTPTEGTVAADLTIKQLEGTCATGFWNGSSCVTCPENFTLNPEKTQCVNTKTEITEKMACTNGTWNGKTCVTCPKDTTMNADATECISSETKTLDATCEEGVWNGSACLSCPANATLNDDKTECMPTAPTLRSLGLTRKIIIGAGAVQPSALRDDPVYGPTMAREFAGLTPGNVMKFGPIHPQKDTYNFTDADAIVEYAKANDMKIRGHTFVWHVQQPRWIEEGSYTRDQLLTILREHITTVMGRYKGKIFAWDVVNEAVMDDGTMRETVWSKTIGPDYIGQAFRMAHQVDPSAKLIYNDYANVGMDSKSNAIYTMVKGMKERGVPIHGVGMQSHFQLPPPSMTDVDANFKRLAALGLEVHVTELDVRMLLPATESMLSQQTKAYSDYLRVCLANTNCTMFYLWGFTDKYSWIPGKFPGYGDALIFDKEYKPKAPYHALMSVLKEPNVNCATGTWNGSTCISCPANTTLNETKTECKATAITELDVKCPDKGYWNGTKCITCPVNAVMNLAATGCIGGTILGIFNTSTPQEVIEDKVRATRRIYGASTLIKYFAGNLPNRDIIQEIKAYYDAGIRVIVSVMWLNNFSPLPSPGTAAYDQNLNMWKQFISQAGPYLYGVALENEPIEQYALSDLGMNEDKSWKGDVNTPAIQWFRTLASAADALRKTNPKLSSLLIGAPAMNRLASVSVFDKFKNEACFPWAAADPNIDFIDIHVHVGNLDLLKTALENAASKNTGNKMLVATEWSQAGKADVWFKQAITVPLPSPMPTDLKKSCNNNTSVCNSDYLTYAYTHPLDLQTWNNLISTVGYDSNYMKDGFELFKAKGFTAVFYGAHRQFGDVFYDAKQLYANLTVVPNAAGKPQPNYEFVKWFTDLSSSLQTP